MTNTPPSPTSTLRKPVQERSRARYQMLLDAAHELLLTQELQEVGLYLVAKRAGVPPASAYHFFPTPAALMLALADRYHQIFEEFPQAIERSTITSWQMLLQTRLAAAVDIYNDSLPIRKLFLGGHTTPELVQSEAAFNVQIAAKMLPYYEQFFHMPHIENADGKYLVMLTLVDAIWRLSFTQHGVITPSYAQESFAVAVAYCRTFLPETIPLRREQ